MWKAILVVSLVVILVTSVSIYSVPLLMAHGSSAAFNMGVLLCIITLAVWFGAYKLLFNK